MPYRNEETALTSDQLKACREAFEKYAKDTGLSIHRNESFPGENDFYIDGESTVAFKDFKAGWQAAWNNRDQAGDTKPFAWLVRRVDGEYKSVSESYANQVKNYFGGVAIPVYTHPPRAQGG